jgi:hypothetical protein
MTYQTLQTLSQIAIAIGLMVSALGGYGAYHYQKKVDAEKERSSRPIVDLCHRGISVTEVDDEKLYFDIPYCSGKNANAYNVKLETGIILRDGGEFKMLMGFSNSFPDNIILSYETGKSMSFSLHPLKVDSLVNMYIGVRGSYSNDSGTSTYRVFDIFKFNGMKKEWVRTLGEEDRSVRAFFEKMTE